MVRASMAPAPVWNTSDAEIGRILRFPRRTLGMALIWLRYGDGYAASPMNCLYSACRGLLVDGHNPELCAPPQDQHADRGFFCHDEDETLIRATAARVERVSANPRGRSCEAQETLRVARTHHRMGVAHIWLASEID